MGQPRVYAKAFVWYSRCKNIKSINRKHIYGNISIKRLSIEKMESLFIKLSVCIDQIVLESFWMVPVLIG